MDCPQCKRSTRVIESRPADDGLAVRRRRSCSDCGHRFTTYERHEPEPLWVRKRDGARQRFDRDKLRDSLTRAAHKRPVSRRDVGSIVDRAQAMIAAEGGEVRSDRIASHCLQELGELDHGAYLQFAGTLPEPNPDFAGSRGRDGRRGSVREPSNHG